MQIKVTGKNLDIGEALRIHVDERLQQFRQKYFEGTVHAHVTVEKQRSSFQTDCSLHLATGLVLQSHGTAAEAFPSFDAAAQHLEKQLKRYKQRLKDHHKERREPVRQSEAASYVIQAGDDEGEEPRASIPWSLPNHPPAYRNFPSEKPSCSLKFPVSPLSCSGTARAARPMWFTGAAMATSAGLTPGPPRKWKRKNDRSR